MVGRDRSSSSRQARQSVPTIDTLTANHYVDPAVYRHEVDTLLPSGWLPMCRVDQLARTHDRFARNVAGRPLVATRDNDGEIHVLANVCAHRGSVVAEPGAGHGTILVCPYHRWAFRLDGSLVGAPLADGCDLAGARLTPVRHAVWEGFVLVNLSGDAPEPSESLVGLSRAIAPWRWSELEVVGNRTYESTWNWKVMVENWIECYHHIGTHRESLESIQPARSTRVVDGDRGAWTAMTVDSVDEVVAPPDQWIPGVTAECSRHLSVWSAFPYLLGGSMADHAFWLHIDLVGVDVHTVTWHLLAHPRHVHLFPAAEVERRFEMLDVVHTEDMAACRRVQAGLASGLFDRPRLADLDAPIADFQRWYRGAEVRGAEVRRQN